MFSVPISPKGNLYVTAFLLALGHRPLPVGYQPQMVETPGQGSNGTECGVMVLQYLDTLVKVRTRSESGPEVKVA